MPSEEGQPGRSKGALCFDQFHQERLAELRFHFAEHSDAPHFVRGVACHPHPLRQATLCRLALRPKLIDINIIGDELSGRRRFS
jgi:hypothetical protein